jgi:peptide/nickel transport system substrate-binding protein
MDRLLLPGATRRGFIKTSGALLLAAGMGAMPARAQAVKGGRLVVGMTGGSVSDSLDPRTFRSSGHACVGYTLGNGLTEIEKDNQLVGELAESWESSADAKVWKFNLRRGVTFHNGKTMTSADVIFSLNLHRGEQSTSAAKGLTGDITDITADGPDAIIITLSRGNADLPFLLSDFRMLIVPEATTDFGLGIFTGPYQLVAFNPGESLIARRNPNYWKADRAHVDEVEVAFVEDRVARINGLMTGELHLVQQVDDQAAALIQQTPGVHIEKHASGGHTPILMHADKPPFDNADLRLAMKYAIDREQVIALLGGAAIGNDHPIPPHDPFHAGDIPQRIHDPDRAAFHFRRADVSGALPPLSINNVTHPRTEEIAATFQQNAARAGIAFDLLREPTEGFWSQVWLAKSFMIASWGGRPTADMMLTSAYHSTANWNDSKWFRPEFDQIIDLARSETDFARRRQLYHDAQLMIHEDGGACIPFFRNNVDGVRDEVKGYYPAGSFAMSGLRVVERVWMEG